MRLRQLITMGFVGTFLTLPAQRNLLAHEGDTTLIHGCVAKDGTTRIVSPNTTCKSSETPRHWPTDARIITNETRITNTETKNIAQDTAISTLQGQVGGASGGLVVKDSLGQVVGKVIDAISSSAVLLFRQIGNTPAAFQIFQTGFVQGGSMHFVYTTSNCTGTRYMQSAGVVAAGSFMDFLQSTDSQTWFFPTRPAQSLSIQSAEFFGPGENPSGVGSCASFTPFEQPVGTVSTISAATLGTPPFRLE